MNIATELIPVSAIIPTKDRAQILVRTLNSIFQQSHVPGEVVIIDASDNELSKEGVKGIDSKGASLRWLKALVVGAAQQRLQGISAATQCYIFFLDDDILLESGCIERIFRALKERPDVGGVNAMIVNQQYSAPGRVTRLMYRLLDKKRPTWAGRVIGPAWNLLPEDDHRLPEYVACDWLNTGCTIYRRDALPDPVFPAFFRDYSFLEDVALSLQVARKWTLLNARTARIFHDSQQGSHKRKLSVVAEMEVVNRYFVMTVIMHKTDWISHLKFALFQLFSLVSGAIHSRSMKVFFENLKGKLLGFNRIIRERSSWNRI